MNSPTQDEEIDEILNTATWGSYEVKGGIARGICNRSELKSALNLLMLKERRDELKSALNKGYFIPEMESQAEDRIATLTSQIEGSKSDDKM